MHFSILSPSPQSIEFTRDYYQLLQCMCRISISQDRICGCSEVCGEVPGSVVRCNNDLGEGDLW